MGPASPIYRYNAQSGGCRYALSSPLLSPLGHTPLAMDLSIGCWGSGQSRAPVVKLGLDKMSPFEADHDDGDIREH